MVIVDWQMSQLEILFRNKWIFLTKFPVVPTEKICICLYVFLRILWKIIYFSILMIKYYSVKLS